MFLDIQGKEMDILTDNSFEISCGIEMSADEADMDKLDTAEVEKISSLYEGIEDKATPVSDVAESQELIRLQNCLVKYKALLIEKSPTAKLWLQYINI